MPVCQAADFQTHVSRQLARVPHLRLDSDLAARKATRVPEMTRIPDQIPGQFISLPAHVASSAKQKEEYQIANSCTVIELPGLRKAPVQELQRSLQT